LKVEFYDRYLWPTKAAARLAVGDWIERVYNRRPHSVLDYVPPEEYEAAYYAQTQGSQPATPQP
jgi:putative transposase